MSVLLETSLGDMVIDLLVDYAPKECENFLKLCKMKYYNFAPVHTVQKDFSFQTGDPLGPLSRESDGGSSIWGLLGAAKTYTATLHPKLKHRERGTVSMATTPHPTDPDARLAGSQFLVTLGDDTDYLDGKAAIFAKLVEGFDVLEKINAAIVDKDGHPLVDIRIKHTVVLDDPYPDPAGLRAPSASPPPSRAQLATVRIADDADLDAEVDAEAAEKKRRETEARAQALTLEMMGDLPFAEVAPPENVLFVCKLNPVTADADLELIFSRFGKILSCEVVRDRKTGDSLQYAFVEFAEKDAAEAAYFKMQNVLIDDRRIHVDFSQSVSKLSDVWRSGENAKRTKCRGGGWGGVEGLEKWRKYRVEDRAADDGGAGYGMVYDQEEMRGRHQKQGEPEPRDDDPPEPPRRGAGAGGDTRPRGGGGDRGSGGRGGRGGGAGRGDWDRESRRRSRSRSPKPDRRDERDRDRRRDDDRRRGNDRYDDRDRGDRHRDRDRHRHRDGGRDRGYDDRRRR